MSESVTPILIYQFINQDAVFIDLRSPYQYHQNHIPNFINIPDEHPFNYLSRLPKDKPIYLICYSGRSAKRISNQLRAQGYQSFYIEGGFQAFLNLSKNKYY